MTYCPACEADHPPAGLGVGGHLFGYHTAELEPHLRSDHPGLQAGPDAEASHLYAHHLGVTSHTHAITETGALALLHRHGPPGSSQHVDKQPARSLA